MEQWVIYNKIKDDVPALEAEIAAAMGESTSTPQECPLSRRDTLGDMLCQPCFMLWNAVTWNFWLLLPA